MSSSSDGSALCFNPHQSREDVVLMMFSRCRPCCCKLCSFALESTLLFCMAVAPLLSLPRREARMPCNSVTLSCGLRSPPSQPGSCDIRILQPLTAMDAVCGKKNGGSVSLDISSDLLGVVKEPNLLGKLRQINEGKDTAC